ncbi:MAG: hypothetical protein HYR88_00715 [Verrucomicrobia bacterium]|nr:hypothetical protein [Verrucomicrobiota bacterium]MBI3870098.1 hypothetical protein [Verrucomicrobiota bacterium]
MIEWHIQSRSHACQSCGQEFRDHASYHTLLFDERQEYHRQDICLQCWETQYRDARDRKGFISHWQGVYEAPPASPPDPIQKDTAETLLRKLMERNDPVYLPATFILAVMLERKRLLRVKEQLRQGARRIFIYEQPRTGDLFSIPDPDLQLDQLENVQRQVGDLLEHGLRAEGEAISPAPDGPVVTGGPPAMATEVNS